MNFVEEIELTKKIIETHNYDVKMVLNHLQSRKIHHTVALLIISSAFNLNREDSREILYQHSFYSKFKNEVNPFTEDLGSISIKLNNDAEE